MANMFDFAMNMINQNPQVMQSPNAQSMVDVIKSGDNQKGEQMARKLCQSMGISYEDAYSQACKFFGL